MEHRGKGIPPADIAFRLPSEEFIRSAVEKLDEWQARPSLRSRFFPRFVELADQEMSGRELTLSLLGLIDVYSRNSSRPDEAERRMIAQLPTYLGILMSDKPLLDDTLNLLEEMLKKSNVGAELTIDDSAPATDTYEASLAQAMRGAPRGIKATLRLASTERTEAQQRSLESYFARVGKSALLETLTAAESSRARPLRGSRRSKFSQPSQRELAAQQAAREQQHAEEL